MAGGGATSGKQHRSIKQGSNGKVKARGKRSHNGARDDSELNEGNWTSQWFRDALIWIDIRDPQVIGIACPGGHPHLVSGQSGWSLKMSKAPMMVTTPVWSQTCPSKIYA